MGGWAAPLGGAAPGASWPLGPHIPGGGAGGPAGCFGPTAFIGRIGVAVGPAALGAGGPAGFGAEFGVGAGGAALEDGVLAGALFADADAAAAVVVPAFEREKLLCFCRMEPDGGGGGTTALIVEG